MESLKESAPEAILALFTLVNKGDVSGITSLIETQQNLFSTFDSNGESALHVAAKGGNVEVATVLCNNGANTHLLNSTGLTALQVAKDEKMIQYLTSLTSKTTTQLSLIVKLMTKEKIFEPNVIQEEVDRFYNKIGMPDDYFSHFPGVYIATHLSAIIASKHVAKISGKPENVYFRNELDNFAFYLTTDGKERVYILERKIEDYLTQTPSTHSYLLESYQSTQPAIEGGSECLRFVHIQRFKKPNTSKGENFFSPEFKQFKSLHILKVYEEVMNNIKDSITPVIKINKENDGYLVIIALQKSADKSFLSIVTQMIDSQPILKCNKRYISTFADGTITYSFHFTCNTVNADEEIGIFTSKASMLTIIPPSTKLYSLLMDRKLTARQFMYAYSASKFSYYFTQRTSEEFGHLTKILQNDSVNLARLYAIQNKMKRDTLSEGRIIDCIFANIELVKELFVDFAQIALGEKKPTLNLDLQKKIQKQVFDGVDESILKSFLSFNANLLKTNFYRAQKSAISYRFDPSFLKDSNYPQVPFGLFMVIGSDFMGFHVRFRDVARGGIRVIKSPTPQAFATNAEGLFSEGYNLANTQHRKNKDIPEGGSKGTILLYQGDQSHTVQAFQKYIDSILDLLLRDKVMDHYGKEEILFMGPDENTAELMDWAALHAKKRGYPFWKAFTTGKSQELGGIPHNIFGMTTAGVHQYVLGIMKKLSLDETQVTKVSTGGPDGDLGGNEILISKDKTLSIIDGSGVLYDPKGLNRQELVHLVNTHSMIIGYDSKLLSADGFKVLTDQNDITLPNGEFVENGTVFRNNFHLHPLFKSDLFVPCGGRPAAVNINNVNKMFDNGKPRFKYIVEGANLFLTQDARLVLEDAGVILFKDASANKGGVTSSSLEVLSALAFTNEEFAELMQEKEGKTPEYYSKYVVAVLERIKHNANLEFECLWNENKKTGIAISKLSDTISNNINNLNDKIKESDLWDNKALVKLVMKNALPEVLIQKLGLDTIMQRVPDNYLHAIFSCYLASSYLYKYGFSASEFNFFEFMQVYMKQTEK